MKIFTANIRVTVDRVVSIQATDEETAKNLFLAGYGNTEESYDDDSSISVEEIWCDEEE